MNQTLISYPFVTRQISLYNVLSNFARVYLLGISLYSKMNYALEFYYIVRFLYSIFF